MENKVVLENCNPNFYQCKTQVALNVFLSKKKYIPFSQHLTSIHQCHLRPLFWRQHGWMDGWMDFPSEYFICLFMFSVKYIEMSIWGDVTSSPNSQGNLLHNCVFFPNAGVNACSNADKKSATASNLKRIDPNT